MLQLKEEASMLEKIGRAVLVHGLLLLGGFAFVTGFPGLHGTINDVGFNGVSGLLAFYGFITGIMQDRKYPSFMAAFLGGGVFAMYQLADDAELRISLTGTAIMFFSFTVLFFFAQHLRTFGKKND
jgi:hypothetical protein